MNRIFKVIWSETKHAYCVVSEIAHTHGRVSTRRTKAALVAVLILTSSALGQGVQADGTNSYSWGSGSEATGDQSVAAGDSAKALGQGSTAVGQGAQANERFSTALGQNAHAEKEFSTALGVSAQAKGAWSTALGQNAIAEKDESTALGYYAQAQGKSSTALGQGAQAQADNSTAVGQGAQATGHWSTALGQEALADRENSTALGRAVKAQGNSSTAVGSVSQAKGDISTAIGFEVQADGYASVAIGKGAQTKSNCSIAVGDTAQTNGDISMALGRGAIADKNYAMALGNQAQALGESSIALGDAVKAEKDNSIAFGRFAQAQVEGGIALGSNSIASIDKGVIGYDPSTGQASKDTSAIWQATRAALSVGNTSDINYLITRQITGVAAGTQDTDAVNVAQLKALNTKVDKGAVHYFSVKSTEKGENSNRDNDGATGEDAVAIGVGAQAKGGASTALGLGVIAEKDSSTAVGCSAYAQGEFSTALGYKANAQGNFSMALGQEAQALEVSSTALGSGAKALLDGSVALGFGSIASIGKGVFGYDPFTGKASIENSAVWKATHAALSVGSTVDGNNLITRQITGVAAGTQDTDAVNVAQLKALNKKVDGKKDIHFFSSNGSDSGINYDNQGARAGYTTAIGPDAMATEENSQAFGYRARAIGHSSIVFGVESTASGARDIAIGYGSHAVGSDNTNTSWNDTIAIGWNALSRGGSFASGTGAVAGGSGSVALGAGAYVGTKWLDDETQKAQNVNKWVLTRSFLDKGLRDELKAKFPEKFTEWERRAKNMPAAMGSDYLEQKLRTLAMEQLPQMTSPSMKNTMKDMESSIAIGRRTKVYSASAIAIGSEAKVGENLDGAIALGNQSLATRNAGIFGYDPTSDAKTWTDFKKAHPEAGIGAAREQEIQREMNDLSDEVAQMGPTYQAWVDKEKYPDKYLDERKAYAEAHGNTLNGNNEWVEWVLHARNEQQKLWNKGQELTNKYNNLQKELNGGANLGKGAWIGNKAALAIGNEEDGITRQITGVAAGTKDTDAVNVAQLKVLNTKVDKVAEGSVHYLSVNSSEQGAGSNYKNDGAKGVHAVAIGAYATADSAGGVALGRDSTEKRAGGLFGYNPKNGAAFVDGTAVAEYLGKTTEYDALQTEMTAKKTAVEEAKKALKENVSDTTKKENLTKAYQALEAVQQKENLLLGAYRSAGGYGAFSVGNEEKGITRQITGVAAGTKDTDAVNVAQLKVLNTKVDKVAANSTAYTVETKENDDNTTTVTIKSNKAGDKGTAVTVATKDIHITSGTYDKTTKKLTFTTNTNTTFNVDMNDVINAAAEGSVHYLSVNSSEQGAGSNYKNDGAVGENSIAIGNKAEAFHWGSSAVGNQAWSIGAFSQAWGWCAIASGEPGIDKETYDKLSEAEKKNYQLYSFLLDRGDKSLYYRTKYEEYTPEEYRALSADRQKALDKIGYQYSEARKKEIMAPRSLAIGIGARAVGKYTTAVGNWVNAAGIQATALGTQAKATGDFSIAAGDRAEASGGQSVAVGTQAKSDGVFSTAVGTLVQSDGALSTAVGVQAKSSGNQSIAMGYKAETVKGGSAAIGSGAKTQGTASTAVGGLKVSATVDYGAAFGSFSVAQREKGVSGYLANGQAGLAWKSNLGAFSVGDDVKGYSRQITGVAAGSEDTDAVNVAQLKAIEKKIGTGGTNGKDGKSAYDIWLETQTDKTKTKQDFLDSLKGKDGKDGTGADIDIKGDTGSGVSVTSNTESGKKTYTIGLSTKIKAGEVTIDGTKDKENIAVGDVKINGEKGKGTITGLSNKTWDPNHIESGRAATEDQLKAVTQGMTEISGGIAHVGAHAAALAALHPLDFNADEKLDLAAGVGNYNGANAVAVGAYYRPNERTMFSIGGSFGSGKNMVNGGVSLKVGSGSVRSMAKAVPARQLAAQQREIREQRAQIQVLQQRDKDKEAQIQALWQEIRQLKKLK